jgi:sugar lactone lactonase YvrE
MHGSRSGALGSHAARLTAALLGLVLSLPITAAAHPPIAEPAQLFAGGIAGPEGLAFTHDGGLIVGSTTGEVRRYTANGSFTVLANLGVRIAGITVLRDRRVLVAAFNTNEIWSIDPSGAASVFASGVGSPNFIAESKRGPIWVSSSLGASILDVASGSPVVAATGLVFPNGLAIGRDNYLYVAETLLNRVVRFPIANDGSLGVLEVYATGLPLADGLAFDRRRNLLVVGGGTLKIVEATTGQVIHVPTDPLSNWPSNLAFGRGKGFKRRDAYMANFGPMLGDGTNIIRFRYNHRGTKLVK